MTMIIRFGFYLSVVKIGGPARIQTLIDEWHPNKNFIFLFNPIKKLHVWVIIEPQERKEFFEFIVSHHINILNLFGEETDGLQRFTNQTIPFSALQNIVQHPK